MAEDGCTVCDEGKYCDPVINSLTTQDCVDGNYCPEGSELQTTCRGKYYCSTATNFQEVICPVNHKCEPGTGIPIRCSAGVICPEGSERGTKCAKGFDVQQISGVDTCVACVAGYYSIDAASP